MDEDALNATVRKFLKTVGVTSQREIEIAVRRAIAEGRLTGEERLPVRARVTLAQLDLAVDIDGEIALN